MTFVSGDNFDGNLNGIAARIYDSNFATSGSELVLNDVTAGSQTLMRAGGTYMAVLADGATFVVCWTDLSGNVLAP